MSSLHILSQKFIASPLILTLFHVIPVHLYPMIVPAYHLVLMVRIFMLSLIMIINCVLKLQGIHQHINPVYVTYQILSERQYTSEFCGWQRTQGKSNEDR
jgi:hypothetical protein